MPKWTQEMKDKRIALHIARIMEDQQVSYEEAEQLRVQHYKQLGSKGGSTTGEAKVRGDKSYYSEIGTAGGKKSKRGK